MPAIFSALDSDYLWRFPGRVDLYKAVFHAHDCCRGCRPSCSLRRDANREILCQVSRFREDYK
jgi:hypothetical protein